MLLRQLSTTITFVSRDNSWPFVAYSFTLARVDRYASFVPRAYLLNAAVTQRIKHKDRTSFLCSSVRLCSRYNRCFLHDHLATAIKNVSTLAASRQSSHSRDFRCKEEHRSVIDACTRDIHFR